MLKAVALGQLLSFLIALTGLFSSILVRQVGCKTANRVKWRKRPFGAEEHSGAETVTEESSHAQSIASISSCRASRFLHRRVFSTTYALLWFMADCSSSEANAAKRRCINIQYLLPSTCWLTFALLKPTTTLPWHPSRYWTASLSLVRPFSDLINILALLQAFPYTQ